MRNYFETQHQNKCAISKIIKGLSVQVRHSPKYQLANYHLLYHAIHEHFQINLQYVTSAVSLLLKAIRDLLLFTKQTSDNGSKDCIETYDGLASQVLNSFVSLNCSKLDFSVLIDIYVLLHSVNHSVMYREFVKMALKFVLSQLWVVICKYQIINNVSVQTYFDSLCHSVNNNPGETSKYTPFASGLSKKCYNDENMENTKYALNLMMECIDTFSIGTFIYYTNGDKHHIYCSIGTILSTLLCNFTSSLSIDNKDLLKVMVQHIFRYLSGSEYCILVDSIITGWVNGFQSKCIQCHTTTLSDRNSDIVKFLNGAN